MTINIPMVISFAYGSTAIIDFDVQLLHSIIQKNPGAMAIDPVQESYNWSLKCNIVTFS